MDTMNTHWEKYSDSCVGDGYYCTGCGQYVYTFQNHVCPCTIRQVYTWPIATENKTEKAYGLLKLLVKEEIIPEPKSYKKFCDLIDKIAIMI